MNVSWSTFYEASDLYLIVGYDFVTPIQLLTNSAQPWYQWEVSTDSTNSSQIYAFRVVNAQGTEYDKLDGGFLSAPFYINSNQASIETTSTSLTRISTSAIAPVETSKGSSTQTSATQTTTTAAASTTPTGASASAGLSEGAKVGVGVGVGVGAIGIGALLAALWFWKKSRKPRAEDAAAPTGPFAPYTDEMVSHPASTAHTPSVVPSGPVGAHYKPAEVDNVRNSELDAGQGHLYSPELYPAHSPAVPAEPNSRPPAELQ
ncbi:hypothetical protein F4780DRAFT_446263 [Xylariomycetidae sp. FL0641]|nr:hypothetical protein F4780DRAFT_446263 [Xylariomycetidae sp. FL0641]